MKTEEDSNTIIAVEFPASCGQKCPMCRTPDNAVGDHRKVAEIFWRTVSERPPREVYLVSSGETGAAKDFDKTVSELLGRGIAVSVACAAPVSVVAGLTRVEVSATLHTIASSYRAIEKAIGLGIPVTVSLVDDGAEDMEKSTDALREAFPEIRGCLVRAQQRVGRAREARGESRCTRFSDAPMGIWPVWAYVELAQFAKPDIELTCFDRWGRSVPYVGGYVPSPKD